MPNRLSLLRLKFFNFQIKAVWSAALRPPRFGIMLLNWRAHHFGLVMLPNWRAENNAPHAFITLRLHSAVILRMKNPVFVRLDVD